VTHVHAVPWARSSRTLISRPARTAYIQYGGHDQHAGGSGGFGGTLPKYRFFTTLDWTYQDVDLTLSNTYVSSTVDTGVNGTSMRRFPSAAM